ncbi:hypothetical protein [Methylobacillus flagellatus]|uniref:hypothetical protein n=1 Tax=Methylobacillus flagellatus TaxID=405 RepID=UPI0010F65554|nr:hypothetical protein [Methylobacillus flagellatus]
MSTAKLRIDISQGLLEVEGSDQLVREIYADFKDQLHGSTSSPTTKSTNQLGKPPSPKPDVSSTDQKSSGRKKASAGGAQPSIVKDLDLSGKAKEVERLKDFHTSFTITSNLERNLVFMYYLQHKIEVSPITPDHVFTCYRDVGVKVPTALVQSLRDASNRRGWLDTANTNDLKVTTPGMNYLEHDLPKAKTD